MATVKTILLELVEHIESNQEDTKSVFLAINTIDSISPEDLPVRLQGQECATTRISYNDGELYDIYVVKI